MLKLLINSSFHSYATAYAGMQLGFETIVKESHLQLEPEIGSKSVQTISRETNKLSLTLTHCAFALQLCHCSPCVTLQIKLVKFFHPLRSFASCLQVSRSSLGLKLSYLQSLMVFCGFCEVVVKQYRQGDSFSSVEFLCFRWTFKVIIHRLLTWCACW